MITTIADFAPPDVEAGVGLVLQDISGRHLFFLAGTRHHCPPGELFYAGIGGHREPGEDWLACAYREAQEEIGRSVEILPADISWYIPHGRPLVQLKLLDQPRPFALYEMVHPPDSPWAGQIYRIVIYRALLRESPQNMPPDELLGVIALSEEQVLQGLERKAKLAELLDEGACLVAGGELVDRKTRLYPIGTAKALALILRTQKC